MAFLYLTLSFLNSKRLCPERRRTNQEEDYKSWNREDEGGNRGWMRVVKKN